MPPIVLLAVGTKLGEIATKRYALLPQGRTLIQVDIEAEEFGRTSRIELGIWADARAALRSLTVATRDEAAAFRARHLDYVQELATRRASWLAESTPRLTSDERPVNMARLVSELNTSLPEDAILVADGGFAGHWTGLLYDTKRAGRTYVADRGFASIGYGLPGAIGAALGAPDIPVVAITGDAGFNMTIGELETARRIGLGITLIVVNNAASGYVKALQHAMYGGRYQSSDLVELDYAALARGFGCRGIRVEDPGDLRAAIEMGITERDRPTVIDVVVTRDPAKMLPGVDAVPS